MVERSCIDCLSALCGACHQFEINGRPWCPSCAKPHVPGALGTMTGWIWFAVKVFLTLAALLLPGYLGVDHPMDVSAGLASLLPFLYFAGRRTNVLRVDEIVEGGRRRRRT